MNFFKISSPIFILLAGWLLLCSGKLWGQIQNIENGQQKINQLVQEEKALSQQIEKELQQLKKKSAQITKLKEKPSRNILQERKLQHLLQDSKQIADHLDQLERKRRTLKREIHKLSRELIELIDQQLLTIFRETKSLQRDSKEYHAGVEDLIHLYQLRLKIAPLVEKSVFSLRLIPVEIEKTDSDFQKQNKLDFLRDQKDYLMSINLILNEKIKSFKRWYELTSLADNLLEDIQLQQNRDEAIPVSSHRGGTGAQAVRDGKTFDQVELKLDADKLVIPIEIDNPMTLDHQTLEAGIKTLQKIQNLIQTKADSIGKIITKVQ